MEATFLSWTAQACSVAWVRPGYTPLFVCEFPCFLARKSPLLKVRCCSSFAGLRHAIGPRTDFVQLGSMQSAASDDGTILALSAHSHNARSLCSISRI